MDGAVDLSIIIINWRSADFLRKALTSILSPTSVVTFEVIVLDNASFDGSAEMMCQEFPRVHFIQSEENLGFAKANNLGFRVSKGRFLLFLNPDTEVRDGALQALVSFIKSRPDAGIVGAQLLNSDMTIQTSCIQAFPTILNQVFDTEYLREKFPRSALWGTWPLFEPPVGPARVEVVSGACLLIRRETFEQVGMFTENYFMYSEDVDLCYKAKQAAWNVYYERNAIVVHHGGQSSAKKSENNFATVMTRESLYNFLKVRRGKLYSAAFRVSLGMAALGRLLMLGSIMVLTLGRFERDSLPAAMKKWTGVFRWAVGLERWANKSSQPPSVRVPVQ
jgi:GT2 family glycosyltransferase